MQWPHAPAHWLFEPGIYMITASTYKKMKYLNTPERRDYFRRILFSIAEEFDWQLKAWAILENHYHFIGKSPDQPESLRRFIAKLHMITAKEFNLQDQQPGRKIWFQFWDTQITFQSSYLARLRYVNQNPVKHIIATCAENYPWCSASWFMMNAPASFVETMNKIRTDRINIYDDF